MYKRNGAYAMCFSNMCPPLEITSVLAVILSYKISQEKIINSSATSAAAP